MAHDDATPAIPPVGEGGCRWAAAVPVGGGDGVMECGGGGGEEGAIDDVVRWRKAESKGLL